jgi:hypothetical protein
LRGELEKANPAAPDLKKSIDDAAMVSHLPYFAEKDPFESMDPKNKLSDPDPSKPVDPSQRESERPEQRMLYGRLVAALAADNATAKLDILNDRITALESALTRQRMVAGAELDLGGAGKEAPRIKDLDVRSICNVIAAIDESLARSGLRRLSIPACAQSRASR